VLDRAQATENRCLCAVFFLTVWRAHHRCRTGSAQPGRLPGWDRPRGGTCLSWASVSFTAVYPRPGSRGFFRSGL